MSDAEEAAAELYQVSPDEFVALRDRWFKELRARGAHEDAAAVAKLRKPTVSAWLINLLVADSPNLSADLSELADQLREAQEQLAGEELRALGRQRHQLVAGLLARARELAAAKGRPSSGAVLGEVETTLRAALADAEITRQTLSGRLVQAVSVQGFGPASNSESPPAPTKLAARTITPPAGVRPSTVEQPSPLRSAAQLRADERRHAAELRKAEQELQQAEEVLRAAEQAQEELEDAERLAAEAVTAAAERTEWLRTQLKQAAQELETATDEAAAARDRVEAGRQAIELARQNVEGAQARADLL